MSPDASAIEYRAHRDELTEYDALLPQPKARSNFEDADQCSHLSTVRSAVIIISLAGVTFASSISSGLLAVGLPVMAEDLQLPEPLLLWYISITPRLPPKLTDITTGRPRCTRKCMFTLALPLSSVRKPPKVNTTYYSLATGCCLLLAGSVADIIGDRLVNIVGTLVLGSFILASGLASNGLELIIFRGLQGIGVSMCLPTGVSILTRSFPRGRLRTFGFSCLGLAQPLGFSLGLIAEALLEAEPGRWRVGWYVTAGVVFVFAQGNYWALPKDRDSSAVSMQSLREKVDFVGVLIASTCLGGFSYVAA
jgi:MFS family permease